MSLTYEEFIDEQLVPVLKIGKIQSSPTMHCWPLKKKLAYLTERKEILYGIWSLENGGNKFSKNFYRAFANEARVLLLSEHNSMPKLKAFQEQIAKEVVEIFDNPKILNYYYHKHEAEITMIRYHSDSYIKSRVLDYKNLYTDKRVGANRFFGLLASFQSEIWLLYQRTQVENWNVFLSYFDEIIRNSDINNQKLNNYQKNNLSEVTENLSDAAFKNNDLFNLHNLKSQKRFIGFANQDSKGKEDFLSSYFDEYQRLESKVCFWVSLYKFPWIKYYKHYAPFREAIDTEISLNAGTHKLPSQLYELIRELVDYKFEKVEFVKNFLEPLEDKEIRLARANPQAHLKKWNKEIYQLMEGNIYTQEELQRIKNMCYLRAMCILPREQLKVKFPTDYFASSVYETKIKE